MPMSDRIAKAEETTRAANEIIAREASSRDQKTARLRAERLALEAKASKKKPRG